MSHIAEIIQSVELEGRTTRDAAEEAVTRIRAEAPEEWDQFVSTLGLAEITRQLTSRRASQRQHERTIARARRFRAGRQTEMEVLDRMTARLIRLRSVPTRLYVTASGINRPLRELTHEDRVYVIDRLEAQAAGALAEVDFMRRIDKRAGELPTGEAIPDDEIIQMFADSFADLVDDETEEE